MNKFLKFPDFPFVILLLVSFAAGIFTFQDYGITWDEPGFYYYGTIVPAAYSIRDRLNGDFDVTRSYGPTNHRLYGPAYLLLGNPLVGVLERLVHLPDMLLWRLVNFLTFLVGQVFFYALCKRVMSTQAALFAASLFITQPLMWGHAFINPKDTPFLTFFIAAVYLGIRMVDQGVTSPEQLLKLPLRRASSLIVKSILPAGAALGLVTSIRVLGPLAGVLVGIYFLLKSRNKLELIPYLGIYGLVAAGAAYLTWPYLWDAPVTKYIEVVRYMSNFEFPLAVLFKGELYPPSGLPTSYLPVLLAITLSEPVWFLFLVGLVVFMIDLKAPALDWRALTPLLLWFFIMLLYVMVFRPPLYDNYRHFIFILPPVFIMAGIAYQKIISRLPGGWAQYTLAAVLIVPGVWGLFSDHPYQYAYYNSFVDWTGGPYRKYETDYWLTCYKEAIEELNRSPVDQVVFVYRHPLVARLYADPQIQVEDFVPGEIQVPPGDYLLVTTRSNSDLEMYPQAPVVYTVSRDGAVFCALKQVE